MDGYVEVSRNYLKPGDKVKMKNGSILTVRSLEFSDFVAEERAGYIKKRTISCVLEPEDPSTTKQSD